jgi:hypothetical protein
LLNVLIPAIRKGGVMTQKGLVKGDAISDDQIVNELNTLYSQRTASNAFAQMYLQRNKIAKNIGVTEGAMGITDLEKQYKGSAQGAEDEFGAAWKDFKAEFGKSMLPQITKMLKVGAEALRSIGQPVNEAQLDRAIKADPSMQSGRWGKLGEWLGLGGQSSSGARPINPVASPSANSHSMTGTVNLDGRKVGTFMADHMGRQASAPLTGTTSFDMSMSLPTPGLSYQR